MRKIAENYKLPYYTMSPTYSVCKDHGYLTGEQYTCPICGQKTEVNSRITGYYRPVQNWNKGKAQEFLDRKTYSFSGLGNYKEEAKSVKEAKPEAKEAESLLLFTTKTCPNCKIVKDMLGKKNIEYTVVDAEENADECNKFEVNQAPTLIAITKDGYEKYANASNIIKYINRK